MIKINDPLCYFIISQNEYTKSFWQEIRNVSGGGGKFMLDMSVLEANSYVGRNNGEWSVGWPTKIREKYIMPAYDKNFNKTHGEITDARAKDVQKLIIEKDAKFAVAYSGGIDSTMVITALIKNLTEEQLKNIYIYCDTASVIENPIFYKKFILGKFKLINSSKNLIEEVIGQGINMISSCSADVLYGSKNILELQSNLYFYTKNLSTISKKNIFNSWRKAVDADTHYSNFKDLIISHYSPEGFPELGESYYDKLVRNIETSDVPVNSLYDFYWWHLFNLKYISISAKLLVIDNSRIDYNELEKSIFDWYCNDDYQKWSMVNNNNGEKIDFASTTLKICARRYIYDIDKNDWYFHFKQKISSNENLKLRNHSHWKEFSPMTKFGISAQPERLYIDNSDVKEYISHHMSKFERNW
jgi:hypothetical protein